MAIPDEPAGEGLPDETAGTGYQNPHPRRSLREIRKRNPHGASLLFRTRVCLQAPAVLASIDLRVPTLGLGQTNDTEANKRALALFHHAVTPPAALSCCDGSQTESRDTPRRRMAPPLDPDSSPVDYTLVHKQHAAKRPCSYKIRKERTASVMTVPAPITARSPISRAPTASRNHQVHADAVSDCTERHRSQAVSAWRSSGVRLWEQPRRRRPGRRHGRHRLKWRSRLPRSLSVARGLTREQPRDIAWRAW